MDARTALLRVYFTAILALFAVDSYADAVASPYVAESSISVSKIPWLFEEGLQWVPAGSDISYAHGWAARFACIALVLQIGPGGVWRRRIATAAAAACYTFAYMATSLNRYQHKYFLCLLMWYIALPEDQVRRFIKASISLLYFWTAVAKVVDGGTFLSGSYLPYLLAASQMDQWLVSYVGSYAGTIWTLVPYGTVFIELALSAMFATGRFPALGALSIIVLHGSFELTGIFRIGYFSYYMFLQCLLLV